MARVLIADDHAEIRRLWALHLRAKSYEVIEAADGRQCLRKMEEECPDVVLLDLGMPVLSGWGVLEVLNERAEIPRTPVIVLTGWAGEDVQERAHRLGAAGALIKPFEIEELLYVIEGALGGDGS